MNITGGIYNGRRINAPDEKIARPTLSKVRMSVFNILYSILGDFQDKTFLDMFGGSGIMGLEALSRGFKEVAVFEKNKTAYEIIKNNYSILELDARIILGDSLKLYKTISDYDVIYVDPPYMSKIYETVIDMFKQNATKNSVLVLEHVVELDLSEIKIIKQKKYGDKFLTFAQRSD